MASGRQTDRCVSYRSMDAAWPQQRSVSAGGRNVAACPEGPGPQGSPGAGSLSEQTVPSASSSACGEERGRYCLIWSDKKQGGTA
jgi:hypothetical protein